MARGITIGEVTNTLDNIAGTEKIPVSSGETEPQVVTTSELKAYVNEGMQEEITDLTTIRNNAAAGATAYHKPSGGIERQDLAQDVKTSLGKADTALQPNDISSWAKQSTKPSYSVSEISGAQATLVSGTNIKTINNESLLGEGNITIEGGSGSGDENVIETVKVNGTALTPDENKAVDIDLSGYALSSEIPTVPTNVSDFNNDAGYLTEHQSLTDYVQKSETAGLLKNDGTVDTSTYLTQHQSLSDYVQKSQTAGLLKNDGTVDTSTYLTQHQSLSDYVQKSQTAGLIKNDGTIDTSTYITSAHEVPSGGNAGQILAKNSATDYDVHWTNQTITYASAYCTTAAGTAAKKASCSLYALQTNSYVHVLMGASNTSASELTLSINSSTAKPIYINGTASSATNYTLPAGTYIVFYDGTNFYFRTDGKIQGLSGTLVCTNSTTGLLKNDGTVDTTSYGTYSKPSGGIPAADIASGVIPTVPSNIVVGSSQSYTISVVSSLPASPDANTIYLVTGS